MFLLNCHSHDVSYVSLSNLIEVSAVYPWLVRPEKESDCSNSHVHRVLNWCDGGAPGAESQCLIFCRHCFWLTAHILPFALSGLCFRWSHVPRRCASSACGSTLRVGCTRGHHRCGLLQCHGASQSWSRCFLSGFQLTSGLCSSGSTRSVCSGALALS